MASSKTCLQAPPPFPLPRPPHSSLRSLIFFLFYPVFCLFPPLRSLVPSYVARGYKPLVPRVRFTDIKTNLFFNQSERLKYLEITL